MHLGEGGGPPDHVRPWLAALAARGSLHVVAPAPGRVLDLYGELGETSSLPYAPLTFPDRAWQLPGRAAEFARDLATFRRVIARVRPDLLVVVTTVLPAAVVAGRLARVPMIVYAAEIIDGGRGRRRLAGRVLRLLTSRLATAIVSCSPAVGRVYADGRDAKLATIVPGVDLARLAGDRGGFRAAHGLDHADPCVAVVGNISRGRAQDVAVRALAWLRADLPGAHLLIAGQTLPRRADLAYRRELVELASRLGVADAVTFVGFVDPIGDVYAAADVVVNPVLVPEALGHSSLEALAAGRPLVAARSGALPELLRDGTDALLVPPGDHAAVAAAVRGLWRDPALRARLAETGRSRVLAEFTGGRDVEEFLAVVDFVTEQRNGQGAPRLPFAAGDDSSTST